MLGYSASMACTHLANKPACCSAWQTSPLVIYLDCPFVVDANHTDDESVFLECHLVLKNQKGFTDWWCITAADLQSGDVEEWHFGSLYDLLSGFTKHGDWFVNESRTWLYVQMHNPWIACFISIFQSSFLFILGIALIDAHSLHVQEDPYVAGVEILHWRHWFTPCLTIDGSSLHSMCHCAFCFRSFTCLFPLTCSWNISQATLGDNHHGSVRQYSLCSSASDGCPGIRYPLRGMCTAQCNRSLALYPFQ